MAEQGNKVANIVSRVETDYKERIVPELMKRFNYSSVMEVPHLEKSSSTWVLVKLLKIVSFSNKLLQI